MKYGANAKSIIDAANERGVPVPKSIAEAPLPEGEYQIRLFEAFEQLSTCRQLGMGAIGPIPWSAIDQYAVRMEIQDDELAYESFVWIIQSLDDLYLKRKGAEIEAERKRTSGKSQGVRGTPVRARKRH